MFSKTLVASTVLALAASTVAGTVGTIPASQCNTGNLQCCNSVQSTQSAAVQQLAGLLGIALGTTDLLAGLTCNPISVIGVGGNSCTQQPVCCTNNSFNGLIAIGCTPVNLNL